MSHPLKAVLVLAAALASGAAIGAGASPAGAPAAHGSAISKEKTAKILELMKVTHADRVGDSMMESFKNIMPASQFERLSKVVSNDDLVQMLLPVYDRHFTDQDLDGLLAFYKTPLGQKVITEMPAVAQESSSIGMKYAQEILSKSAQEQKTAGTGR